MSKNKKNLFQRLKDRDGLVCGICKESLEESWAKYQEWLNAVGAKPFKRYRCDLTIDHIIPKSIVKKSEGFTPHPNWWFTNFDNLQLAHLSCNLQKGNTYEEPKELEAARELGNVPGVPETIRLCELSNHLLQSPTRHVLDLRHQGEGREEATGEKMKTKKEFIKQLEEDYNKAAKAWNTLPGVKLVYPADRFTIEYCYHPKKGRVVHVREWEGFKISTCSACGYPLKGELDD